jgi:hypothetical protein
MGADEGSRKVSLKKDYYIQTTEVTQGQWKSIMGYNPSGFRNCGDDCPVEQISWHDAQKFINKLNLKEIGNHYRLPTEAEWEYAARAGTNTPYSYGKCISSDQANYEGDNPNKGCPHVLYRGSTIPVGKLEPNKYGLFDMYGNVFEWCQDWYADYPSGDLVNPTGPLTGKEKIRRGGYWNPSATTYDSATRNSVSPDESNDSTGFRLVMKKKGGTQLHNPLFPRYCNSRLVPAPKRAGSRAVHIMKNDLSAVAVPIPVPSFPGSGHTSVSRQHPIPPFLCSNNLPRNDFPIWLFLQMPKMLKYSHQALAFQRPQ